MKEENKTFLRVVRIPIDYHGAGGHYSFQYLSVWEQYGDRLADFRFYDSAIDDFPTPPSRDRRGFDVSERDGHYYVRYKLCAPDPLNPHFILYEDDVYYDNTFERYNGLRSHQVRELREEMSKRENDDLIVKIPVKRRNKFRYIFYDTQCRMILLNMEKCDDQWFADNVPCYQDPDDEDMVLYFYRTKI